MVTVEEERCVGCGLCARVCHERCIELSGDRREARPSIDHSLCSTCTQCIAICPKGALSWNGAAPVPNQRDQLPSPDQMAELFKQRRTVRRFKGKGLDQDTLSEIAALGIYAPTNNYDLRVVIVDDRGLMREMEDIIMRDARLAYSLFYRSDAIFSLLSRLTPKIDPKVRVKLAHSVRQGTCMPTLPAALVVVVGDKRVVMSSESAQYALYNMILYAQSKGIASRINASGPLSLDRSRLARRKLGLGRRENVLAMVEMGYPAVRFRNKVTGIGLPVQWNGEDRHEP